MLHPDEDPATSGPRAATEQNLLDRYLHAVGKYLPASRRGDILAELSANLLAEMDDKESELGRPLTAAEQSALIKTHGRPFQVAAGYLPQHYLIGPIVFPYYVLILKVSVTLCAFFYFLVNAIVLAVNGFSAAALLGLILRFPFTALITAAWVTMIFAALEYAAPRYASRFSALSEWKPETLPPIDSAPNKPYTTILDLLFNFAGIIWLAAVPHHLFLLLGPGARYFTAGPVRATPALHALYGPVIALLFVPLVVKTLVVARTLAGRTLTDAQKLLLRTFNGGIGLIILILAVRVRYYFTVAGTAAAEAKFHHAADIYNSVTYTSLRIWLAVSVFTIVWGIVNHYIKTRAPGAAAWREHVQI